VGPGVGPAWVGMGLGASLLAVLIGVDVLLGEVSLSGAYGTAAVASAALTTPRRTALVAVAAVAAAGVSWGWNDATTTDSPCSPSSRRPSGSGVSASCST
jgi:hypothetical protein